MQSDYDNSLQSYFTDMERQRGMFKDYVSAEKLSKRLIVFHGVGGVGKSSLLRMFRLHCKSEKIPIALASGDDAKSVLDVVTRWAEDLKEDGIRFPTLSKTLESYRAIQVKVEDQARKSQNKVADIASKAASKTAETAGGVLLGAAIGSVFPVVGTAIGGLVGSAVGSMSAEALFDWMRSFLNKSEIDLLLDPTKKLSTDFLEDIAKAADKKRIVLLLDTFEQMSALEDWVGGVAQNIQPNILIVIAGRKLPEWNRTWSGWMMNAQVEELKPMTNVIMRELIYRYYATMRGGEPDHSQVDAIIRFAQGLPMVVTSAVQLWVKYGVEDFQSVKAEIVANLVDRLMEGVPSALIPALEAAAVVRWFDQPILRTVMKQDDLRDIYSELRRFPFVRARAEGFALHDAVREILDENLRIHDSEQYFQLHDRAALYFENRIRSATDEEIDRLGLELLYHRICANEQIGIRLLQEMAEKLIQHRNVTYFRAFINDLNTYTLRTKAGNSWLTYYRAQLAEIDRHLSEAETNYAGIVATPQVEATLKSSALSNLGNILARGARLGEPDGAKKALRVLNEARQLLPPDDPKMVYVLNNLRRISVFYNDWESADQYLEQIIDFCQRTGDTYQLVMALGWKLGTLEDRGELRNAYEVEERAGFELRKIKSSSYLQWTILDRSWHFLRAGRYKETEQRVLEAVNIAESNGLTIELIHSLSKLGYYSSYQNKFEFSLLCYEKSLGLLSEIESGYQKPALQGYWGGTLVMMGKLEDAEAMLSEGLKERLKVDRKGAILPKAWLGELYELLGEYGKAQATYEECLVPQWTSRRYLACKVYSGLVRVKLAIGEYQKIPSLLDEAESLAQKYEYNDHLASLRLSQGHLAWENGIHDQAFAFFQKTLIYALRYNRFLLDELISGRPQGTPLRPIIPYCLERGEDGKKILIALRDWWKTGINDIGTLRPDTISPIPEGISLLDAEKLAREREPGDESMQRTVAEQFAAAINT